MGYTQAQVHEFICKMAPIIQAEAKKRGYKTCAAVIAQAIIEGAAGTSKLAFTYHNHFGMKAGPVWVKAGKPVVSMKTMEEHTPGVYSRIVDGFRSYPNDKEGVTGYYDFISAARYSNLKNCCDYITYAELLKKDGYATSSTYVNTLVNTVKKYNLDKYDTDLGAKSELVQSVFPTLKKGSKGEYVKILQNKLNSHNIMAGSISEDGIFGTKTFEAVIIFQAMNDLEKDGIVGPKTWGKLNGE